MPDPRTHLAVRTEKILEVTWKYMEENWIQFFECFYSLKTVKDLLCRNNPWGKSKCGQKGCFSCPLSKDGAGGGCRKE